MRRDKAEERRIARQRIDTLFEHARTQAGEGRLERAARYVALARRVGMKYIVSLGRRHNLRFCKPCGAYLLPGRTARVRARAGKVSVTCLACGSVRRHGYAREQRERRRARAARAVSAAAAAPANGGS